jgi:hypothetical protein
MTDRELMQQALEALEIVTADVKTTPSAYEAQRQAITALRERLAQPNEFQPDWDAMAVMVGEQQRMAKRIEELEAQPEQEPVAWMYHGIRHDDTPHERPSLIWKPEYMDVMSAEKGAKATPLYTTPRQWQGLTNEERNNLWRDVIGWGDPSHDDEDLMKATESKLKEKNT